MNKTVDKKVVIISIVLACLTAAITAFSISYFNNYIAIKTAYVETSLVFAKYKGRLKSQEKLTAEQNHQKLIMDSIQLQYESFRRSYENGTEKNKTELAKNMQTLEVRYSYLAKEFKNLNEAQSQKELDEIWVQLNQYIKDYGKSNGYTYIYGASGDGSLMYADESKNVTNEVIDFANKKYAGK